MAAARYLSTVAARLNGKELKKETACFGDSIFVTAVWSSTCVTPRRVCFDQDSIEHCEKAYTSLGFYCGLSKG
jgi:hypothetical protein